MTDKSREIEISGIHIKVRKLAKGGYSATGKYTGPEGQKLKVFHRADTELGAAEKVRFDIASTRQVLGWPVPQEERP